MNADDFRVGVFDGDEDVGSAFPEEHWRRIRTNNPLERLLREIRRRTRVVGAFPDGQSALNCISRNLI